MKPKNNFYTVWVGHNPGVYSSWDKCKSQVNGYKNAVYKGFVTHEAALAAFNSNSDFYISQNNSTSYKKIFPKGKTSNHPFRRSTWS